MCFHKICLPSYHNILCNELHFFSLMSILLLKLFFSHLYMQIFMPLNCFPLVHRHILQYFSTSNPNNKPFTTFLVPTLSMTAPFIYLPFFSIKFIYFIHLFLSFFYFFIYHLTGLLLKHHALPKRIGV